MTHIKYSLFVYLNGKRVCCIEDADSLPRFQVGDYFGLRPFDVMYDHPQRAIVTDASYDLSADGDQPVIRLFVTLREESNAEEAERLKRVQGVGAS